MEIENKISYNDFVSSQYVQNNMRYMARIDKNAQKGRTREDL